jgi:hypothetical protein
MAKVIEFYVPPNFRTPLKQAWLRRCGKVIEFCTQTANPPSLTKPSSVLNEVFFPAYGDAHFERSCEP